MGAFGKVLTAILGVVAALACIATIIILGYSFMGNDDKNTAKNPGKVNASDTEIEMTYEEALALANSYAQIANGNGANVTGDNVPGQKPTGGNDSGSVVTIEPQKLPPDHIHDYKATVLKKATCLESGQIRYECVCHDYYVVDQLATGHVPDDWELVKQPTDTESGRQVRKCIYCDEIVETEILPAKSNGNSNNGDSSGNSGNNSKHEHLYVATTDREPTCTLAGLRVHTCSCGSFYTESIPAKGHVAEDWINAVEPEVNAYGTAERRCAECGALLDSKILMPLSPSPSPTSSASSSSSPASSGSPAASGSPSPSPSPHVHKYSSYVVTVPNCTEKGVRSFICSCGSSYAEAIELDLNAHHFAATFVAPTESQQGYTVYTCTRCNYSYKDNYLLPLSNKYNNAESEDSANAGDSTNP